MNKIDKNTDHLSFNNIGPRMFSFYIASVDVNEINAMFTLLTFKNRTAKCQCFGIMTGFTVDHWDECGIIKFSAIKIQN